MSRHYGQGGMGSHKHGVSGTSKHKKLTVIWCREVNREMAKEAAWKKWLKKVRKGIMKSSVRELLGGI